MQGLNGKVALVTGAARGQGRSHALRLASEGVHIVAFDLCAEIESVNYPLATLDDLNETVTSVEAIGGEIEAHAGDVRDRDRLNEIVEKGFSRFGRLDIVVANAGICARRDDTLAKAFVDVVDVNLVGVINSVGASLPRLGPGASIIVIGSVAGMMDGATDSLQHSGGAGYTWSKRILVSYVETLALQLAPSMVRINAVHPTNVDTQLLHHDDMYRAFCPEIENPTRQDALAPFTAFQAMPIPFLDPSDVSAVVAFLSSDESRYITGLNVRVDAGALLKGRRAL